MLFFQRISRTVFSPYMPLYIQGILGGIKGAAQTTGTINGILGFATAIAGIIFGRLGDRINKMIIVNLFISVRNYIELQPVLC